jgi:hypothetical protein
MQINRSLIGAEEAAYCQIWRIPAELQIKKWLRHLRWRLMRPRRSETSVITGRPPASPCSSLEVALQPINVADELPPMQTHPRLENGTGIHGFFLSYPCSLDRQRPSSRASLSRVSPSALHGLPRAVAGFCLAISAGAAIAAPGQPGEGLSTNALVEALISGQASAPVPERPGRFSMVLAALQAQSGSREPIALMAKRVIAFRQQPRCGRVSFVLGQPTAKVVFGSFAGQMNICEDGQPPLRTCADQPGVLVPPTAVCNGGKAPVDTAEVAEAIHAAGGLTHEQMLRAWAKQLNDRAQSRAVTASASAVAAPPQGPSKEKTK